jgi:hypothetical protein
MEDTFQATKQLWFDFDSGKSKIISTGLNDSPEKIVPNLNSRLYTPQPDFFEGYT